MYEVFTVVFGYYCIMCVKHTGTESQSESPAEGTRAASAGETGETFLNVCIFLTGAILSDAMLTGSVLFTNRSS